MTFVFSKSSKKALERLDIFTKQRIRKGIHKLPDGDVKRLQGFTNLYRLRISDWRIIFSMTSTEIYIEDVLPRGSAYK
ncbi:MAG: type II toxin-antitoxin system RelE/ParE family toxin [Defluviitaleaceae bacterium]|nr:type II toxin-antitoxin system RelE/ParE family toxin [Defluviitaleaceae bacterium]